MKRFIKTLLARMDIAVFNARGRYNQDGLFTIHSDHFRSDPAFRAAYTRGIEASNGVDPGFEWRVHVALWAAAIALRGPGSFVECGVNTGFISSAIMNKLQWGALDRRFYLIDTFSGPVLAQYSHDEIERGRLTIANDALAAGSYVTDIARVRANYAEWANVVIVQGAVPEILTDLDTGSVAFLHIDMNCALPERAALEFFWGRLSPGGVVLFDDYAHFGHDCQRDSIDAAAMGLGVDILSLPTGQGLIVK
jgi:Methyltransferase domain